MSVICHPCVSSYTMFQLCVIYLLSLLNHVVHILSLLARSIYCVVGIYHLITQYLGVIIYLVLRNIMFTDNTIFRTTWPLISSGYSVNTVFSYDIVVLWNSGCLLDTSITIMFELQNVL